MKRYFCKLPQYIYSFEIYGASNLKEAKQYIRDISGGRVPNGTEFYIED